MYNTHTHTHTHIHTHTDLRLSLKVDQGRILTLWPIMDILCSVGCRLNTTRSSSTTCLSTLAETIINL